MRDDNILIGPGTPCWECGKDYGQHTKDCSRGKKIYDARTAQVAEDAITKVELLKRIDRLEDCLRDLLKALKARFG